VFIHALAPFEVKFCLEVYSKMPVLSKMPKMGPYSRQIEIEVTVDMIIPKRKVYGVVGRCRGMFGNGSEFGVTGL